MDQEILFSDWNVTYKKNFSFRNQRLHLIMVLLQVIARKRKIFFCKIMIKLLKNFLKLLNL